MRQRVRTLLRSFWNLQAGAISAIVCLVLVSASSLPVRSTNDVDLVLVLALDVSGSVNEDEFDLQKEGLARAFRHPAVIKAIQRGRSRRIAVTAVQWAGYKGQHVSVPWTVVADTASAWIFADRLVRMPRRYEDGPTHISGLLEFAAELARGAPFAALRHVIDVSGDGVNNIGKAPAAERDAAVSRGITINGLAILNETTDLDQYYRRNVIGGAAAFVVTANDYEDYPRAILRKLLREIKPPLV